MATKRVADISGSDEREPPTNRDRQQPKEDAAQVPTTQVQRCAVCGSPEQPDGCAHCEFPGLTIAQLRKVLSNEAKLLQLIETQRQARLKSSRKRKPIA
ncbi:hypothetical protein AAVH_32331 [Aphelenchoides avenae]|nr:hypothetical protein AAVH_32331 [Aphelenchus avenae]